MTSARAERASDEAERREGENRASGVPSPAAAACRCQPSHRLAQGSGGLPAARRGHPGHDHALAGRRVGQLAERRPRLSGSVRGVPEGPELSGAQGCVEDSDGNVSLSCLESLVFLLCVAP